MALLHCLDRLVASRHERSRLDLSVFQTDRFTSGFHLILSISFVYRSINLRYPSTDLVTSTPPPTSSRNNYLPLDRRGIPYSLPTAKSNCHYLSVLIIELFFPYIISFFWLFVSPRTLTSPIFSISVFRFPSSGLGFVAVPASVLVLSFDLCPTLVRSLTPIYRIRLSCFISRTQSRFLPETHLRFRSYTYESG